MAGPALVAWDDRVLMWRGGAVLLGGAPWALLRIAPAGRAFVRRLHAAGPSGVAPGPGVEASMAALLLDRGIAHPVARCRPVAAGTVEIVVPAFGDPNALAACLDSLLTHSPGVPIIVVDDASPDPAVAEIAVARGATLLRHHVNRGPAAARNTGFAATAAPLVAFVDSDIEVSPGWLDGLVGHFDDPRVAAVAPRVLARSAGPNPDAVARYQAARSSLDMGPRRELVVPGAPLGYLPAAALLMRRADAAALPFDEALRLGEDVDLIWRLADAGRAVRYEPAVAVRHRMRPTAAAWAGRIGDYGFSAAELDRRHPGRLTPARVSAWNLALVVAALAPGAPAARRAAAAAGTAAAACALLARRLHASAADPLLAPVVVGKGLAADFAATGHLLRREWWPVGWLLLTWTPRAPRARMAAAAMLLPIVREWLTRRPDLDLPRYLTLRLVEDAAYGSGVITAAVRCRRPRVLLPAIRLPEFRLPEFGLPGRRR
jgi:mycofactocin glycosyltransferase